MTRKAFTVEEANALIPTMEAALEEIRGRGEELRRHHEQVQILDALWGEKLADPTTPDHREFLEHGAAVRRLASEIEAGIESEIRSRGVRFPQGGLEHGLLDFPTLLDGRWVYLCWRSGEPRVEAWHELDGGFAGRRPITPALAARMGPDGDAP